MKTRSEVTKLIIPLAGFGTRFLPVSKNYPKEMANLVDRPVIQYLVEEAADSGIREVIFVLNYSKNIIPDYFSKKQHPHQARAYRNSAAAKENLRELDALLSKMKFHSVKRSTTLGDGHSILFAKRFIEPNEIFQIRPQTISEKLLFPLVRENRPPPKQFLVHLIGFFLKHLRDFGVLVLG